MPRALITGITGQDGGYLVERLAPDTELHGLVHDADPARDEFVARYPEVVLHRGDLADDDSLRAVVDEVEPAEIYNLAGISSVALSWEKPALTGRLSGQAAVVLMEAARALQERSGARVAFVQASSAEMFGQAATAPQDEQTPIAPVSPYGAAKAYAHQMAGVLRRHGLYASSCILYNHESPRRPLQFVTRKITAAAAEIGRTGSGVIRLGNLEARRDWGWAPDYVDAMVRAARHAEAGDFVVATGETHSVAEFAEAALRRAGVGDAWRDHVEVDPAFFRPVDAAVLVGDATKARRELGWAPTVGFAEVVGRMVDHDLALLDS
ncbi:GDP-mannose 4,6-dehydratase [Actinotalea sp. M2MS4P-6]|uniref:GDP-mannose 4,6-dehydratase n=1 Tax=Actinotalea sp. M2MS4P-6 TaxID=2983762 RepID=UPI0021E4986F|nr:GDP-mannose 4,6-dehydratase [Actinotalea sp. M2MS4P-6]MCV2395827.1 GDP-mannose 4,6-dehydratase [Actinotalea sp. M2MS4P-6]